MHWKWTWEKENSGFLYWLRISNPPQGRAQTWFLLLFSTQCSPNEENIHLLLLSRQFLSDGPEEKPWRGGGWAAAHRNDRYGVIFCGTAAGTGLSVRRFSSSSRRWKKTIVFPNISGAVLNQQDKMVLQVFFDAFTCKHVFGVPYCPGF